MNIAEAITDADVRRCYAVMAQLRPHLAEEQFVEQVQRQRRGGYQLAYLEEDGQVRAVAGFRLHETLVSGRHVYVDDLVTDETKRSRGWGGALFDWLVDWARKADCVHFELDSGVQRFAAHRFYFTKRMNISSYHFRMKLTP